MRITFRDQEAVSGIFHHKKKKNKNKRETEKKSYFNVAIFELIFIAGCAMVN